MVLLLAATAGALALDEGLEAAAIELVVVVVCSLAPVAVVEVVKLLRSPRSGEA